MNGELKLLSLLLQYPEEALLAARADLTAAAAALPASPRRAAIERFLEHWVGAPALGLQQSYVATFDFTKRSSLYLSYHLHGDQRRRGVVLLRLKRSFAEAGLPLAPQELPDYLPVLLEFAALAPEPGTELLAQLRPAIELVRAALHEAGSLYAGLLDAVCELLPSLSPAQRRAVGRLAAQGPPTELVGLEPFAPASPPGATAPDPFTPLEVMPEAAPAGRKP